GGLTVHETMHTEDRYLVWIVGLEPRKAGGVLVLLRIEKAQQFQFFWIRRREGNRQGRGKIRGQGETAASKFNGLDPQRILDRHHTVFSLEAGDGSGAVKGLLSLRKPVNLCRVVDPVGNNERRYEA